MDLELLAPAGDLEKLKMAVDYGADAVYFGGDFFSLRAGAGNLDIEEIREGVKFCHRLGRKCYLTLNIYAHNEDIDFLPAYLRKIRDIPLDAFLVSDPGVMDVLKEEIPNAVIHLSTQANLTNYRAARFWGRQGVNRLVLARELSLKEIREIRKNIPEEIELEAFCHGAMCISYSGRCLLSNFMTGRDSNRGACAHPCRYRYVLEEEKRPGSFFPVEEDSHGSYILNSKDLCMIRYIPELAESGVTSFKIEGRMKSAYYVATVVHAYRQALDLYRKDPKNYQFSEELMEELEKASHREFTTGFFFGKADENAQNYQTSAYVRGYSFVGVVRKYEEKSKTALVEQRNKMTLGEEIEIFGPDIPFFRQKIAEMEDAETGEPLESAPHPQQMLRIRMTQPVKPGYILRKKLSF